MKIRIPIGLGLLALCLAACGSRAGSGFGTAEEGTIDGNGAGSPQITRAETQGARSFLSKISDAHERLAYAGTRKVRLSYDIQGRTQDLVYEEHVASDGEGHFSLTPGEVLVPRMSEVDSQLFSIDQTRRAGFFFLHRDFRVRDLQLFLRNYELQDTGADVEVAGIACVQLDVRRKSDARRTHQVAIDPNTGLVMRYEEFDANGRSIASVEFESFTLTPDPNDVGPKSDVHTAKPLRLQNAVAELGFEVRVPTLVPSGYRLLKTEKVTDSSDPERPRPWAMLTYSDGAEQIFFLYSKGEAAPAAEASDRSQAPELNHAKVVKVFQAGPLAVVQYALEGEQAIVIGKVSETPLLEMLQSAVE